MEFNELERGRLTTTATLTISQGSLAQILSQQLKVNLKDLILFRLVFKVISTYQGSI